MPQLILPAHLNAIQRMVGNPANRSKATAQQQQGGLSGQIPQTLSAAQQVAAQTGILQPYGTGLSAGEWMTQGVGYETLDTTGNPNLRFGNLLIQFGGVTFYQGGALVFLDPSGNVLSGMRADTGPFEFIQEHVVTTSTYSFVITDCSYAVAGNSATAQTFAIQPFSVTPMPIGAYIEVIQIGAGQITIAPQAGVTTQSDGNLVETAAQYATIGLRQRVQDTWALTGDLG